MASGVGVTGAGGVVEVALVDVVLEDDELPTELLVVCGGVAGFEDGLTGGSSTGSSSSTAQSHVSCAQLKYAIRTHLDNRPSRTAHSHRSCNPGTCRHWDRGSFRTFGVGKHRSLFAISKCFTTTSL